jgi:hypothetical protein
VPTRRCAKFTSGETSVKGSFVREALNEIRR